MGLELAKAWIRVRGDASRVAGDFRRAKPGIMSAVGGIARVATGMLASMGVIGGAAAFGALIRSGEMFNRKMRGSLAIMGDVSDALRKDMKEAAFEAARTTQFSAAQAAESYYYLASAGLDAVQSVMALPQVAMFAQAGMFDLARATDLATDAQSALGLTVKDPIRNLKNLERVTDVLVKANTLANASVEQFSVAITTKAGAAAKIVGKDIEELTAVLAALADQGLKASSAGMAINIVFRDLQTKAIQNKKAFEAAGVAIFDSSGAMNNMADIVGDLEKHLSGMSAEGKKMALMQLGFADKSLIFLQTLLGTSDKIREYEKGLRKAGGTTKDVADKQLTPFQKGWAKLGAAVTKASATLMKWAGPILGGVMSGFAGWFKYMRAGFMLLNDLVKSTADFFMAAWEVGFGYVREALVPFQDNFRKALVNISENLDVMLGSWEGLREGIIQIMAQTITALKIAWMNFDYWFARMVLGTAKVVIATWKEIISALEPVMPEKIFERAMQHVLVVEKRIAKRRVNLEKWRLAQLKELGEESLILSELWEEKIPKLTKLTDRFRKAMKGAAEAAKQIELPKIPGLPEIPEGGEGPVIKHEVDLVGRAGLREYGKQIQDAILKADKPDQQKKMVDLLQKQKDQNDETNVTLKHQLEALKAVGMLR